MAAPDPNRQSLQDEAARLADTARDRASSAFEEVKLASNQLVDRIREYIEDANVKHVAIKKDGRTLLEIPMTIGVGAGAAALLMNPVLSAVGALAALVSRRDRRRRAGRGAGRDRRQRRQQRLRQRRGRRLRERGRPDGRGRTASTSRT